MTPEISEFSYGFALINELVGMTSLKAAPIFPSLIEEGKKGGGYDVKLDAPGVPLFLQFKCAHCMVRSTGKEIRVHKLPISPPYYRFHITDAAKSDQHELLLELDDGTVAVFYAAPRFHRILEINDAWSLGAVAARSIFVRPASVGHLAAGKHCVSFDSKRAFVCSEPREVEYVSAERLISTVQSQLTAKSRSLREAVESITGRIDDIWERRRRGELLALSEWSRLESLGGRTIVSSEKSGDRPAQIVPRQPSPLRDLAYGGLRRLADLALQRFDSQLIVVQGAEEL
jgi:hypothetical protein